MGKRESILNRALLRHYDCKGAMVLLWKLRNFLPNSVNKRAGVEGSEPKQVRIWWVGREFYTELG